MNWIQKKGEGRFGFDLPWSGLTDLDFTMSHFSNYAFFLTQYDNILFLFTFHLILVHLGDSNRNKYDKSQQALLTYLRVLHLLLCTIYEYDSQWPGHKTSVAEATPNAGLISWTAGFKSKL